MEHEYITMTKGDTLSFGMQIDGLDGEDLESAYFTCKESRSDVANVFQKSLGAGISKIDDGEYVVRVAPEDTADVEAGKYFYDLEIGINNDIFTVKKGVLELEEDSTKRGGTE
jgi:hypothetical protein